MGTDVAKSPKLNYSLKSKVICQRKVCLSAAEAFALFPFHSISLLNFVYSIQFGIKKNIYANVKYVYEATKNGQTVVTCSTTRCAEPQHKSLLLAEVLSRDRAL